MSHHTGRRDNYLKQSEDLLTSLKGTLRHSLSAPRVTFRFRRLSCLSA